jgi:hypothetical protein
MAVRGTLLLDSSASIGYEFCTLGNIVTWATALYFPLNAFKNYNSQFFVQHLAFLC